jgi:hypothetical protein
MGYIIENATILKDSKITKCSLLIEENYIAAAREGQFKRLKFIRMNTEAFIMTPTFVQLDSALPLNTSFQEQKKYIIEQFIMKGCTTVFTYATITYEHELNNKLKEMKTALISSPIDFIIGVKIPVRLVTPSFMRKCKKEKVPAIFIEVCDIEDLKEIPWSWIRESLFPYNSPLIPIISNGQKKEAKNVMSKWKVIMEKEKIPAVYEEVEENQPLSISQLNKIGLYPQKASLMHGTELSYNLYLKGREIKNVDEVSLFHYHNDRLVITVHKGKIIRAGDEVLYKPGSGEYVKVKTPSFFSL